MNKVTYTAAIRQKIRTQTFMVLSALALLALLLPAVSAQETPQDTGQVCKRYSTQYGVAAYPDPFEEFQTRYFVERFVDDRFAQLIGMRYCLNTGGLLFKGIEARFATSTGLVTQRYGTMDDAGADANNCTTSNGLFAAVPEDFVAWAVYVDQNDIEGLRFVSESGQVFLYKANYQVFQPNPPAALEGRLIGFRIEFGHTRVSINNTPNQMMKIQLIYNECGCPVSEFIGDQPPSDMTIVATTGSTQQQILPKQLDTIGNSFGIDCGSYTVRLEPDLPFLTLLSRGGQYTDRLQLSGASTADVGVYTVTMVVEQVLANGDGYQRPELGVLDPISYDFTVTVEPCQVTSVNAQPKPTTFQYRLGDANVSFGPFSLGQNPACGNQVDVQTVEPSFVAFNALSGEFEIAQTNDSALIGQYSLEVTHTVSSRTSTSDPSATETLTATGTYDLEVLPCLVSRLSTSSTIEPQVYNLGRASFSFGSVRFETDVDCGYDFTYSLSGAPSSLTFDESLSSFDASGTQDKSLLGEYNVSLQATVSFFDEFSQTRRFSDQIDFIFTINPCQVTQLLIFPSNIAPRTYNLFDPGFRFGSVIISQFPSCGYQADLSAEGLPPSGFAWLDQSQQIFRVEESQDTSNIGLWIVTYTANIPVPIDWTVDSPVNNISQSLTFEFRVNPCQISSYDYAAQPIGPVSYTLQEPQISFGPYFFAQVPACEHPETVTFQNLPSQFVLHDSDQRLLTIPQTADSAFVGTYLISINSQLEQRDYLGNSTPISASVEFVLNVYPCAVDTFEVVSDPIGPIVYTLGQPGLQIGPYQFLQQPNCNYAETRTFTVTPDLPILSLDLIDSVLDLSASSDRALIGTYDVQVSSEFDLPDISGEVTRVTNQVDFVLTVEPCLVDQFQIVQQPDPVVDYFLSTPSLSFGAYTFSQVPNCAYQETVTITGLPEPRATHLEAQQEFFVQETADLGFVGTYDVTVESAFEQLRLDGSTYSVTQAFTFQLRVSPCQVDSFDVVSAPIGPITYTLGDPGFNFGPYEFRQTPNCGYAETVTELDLPSSQYLSHDLIARTFTILQTDERAFVGVYDVVIESSFNQLDINGGSVAETATVEFTITVSPCRVTSYDIVSPPVGTITYILGDPTFTFAPYAFAQSPACDYPEIIQVNDLPSAYVFHNTIARDFTIDRTLDSAFLGVYQLEISSTFQQPAIDGSESPVQQTISFTLDVQPCQVRTFASQIPIADVEYELGQPGFNFGSYSFGQSPDCEYAATVSVTGAPSFVTHEQGLQEFTLSESQDLRNAQTYTVTVTSTINVPEDNNPNPSFRPLTDTITFEIRVLNPCETATLESFSLQDMTVSVRGPFSVQQLEPVQPADSTSLVLGDASGFTYCGERRFELLGTGYENFLSYDAFASRLTLASTDSADLGSYPVTIEAFLIDYPAVRFRSSFTVSVSECVVISLQPATTPNQIYEVYGDALAFQIASFTQLPDCGAPLSYSLKVTRDGLSQGAPWLNLSGRTAQIQTNEFSAIGDYTVQVTARATSGTVSAQSEFKVDIYSPQCEQETIQALSSYSPIEYRIAAQSAVVLDSAWTTSVPQFDCPYSFALTISEESSTERSLTQENAQVVTFDDQIGRVEIETNDFAYSDTQWALAISKTSVLSTQTQRTATVSFQIAFVDICWDSDLLAPQFLLEEQTFDLYQPQSFFFDNMENTSEGPSFCGGFTYQLEYISGPLSDATTLSIYTISPVTISQHEVSATVANQAWIGTHEIRIRGTNGVVDTSPNARGNSGLFQSVVSDPIKLEIRDPCLGTVLNQDLAFSLPDSFVVPPGQDKRVQEFEAPRDSVSDSFGNGYDLCGNRVYNVYNSLDGSPYEGSNFRLRTQGYSGQGAEILTLSLDSYEEGPLLTESVLIEVFLTRYPDSGKLFFYLTLEYRECETSDFSAMPVETQQIIVGDLAYDLRISFSQEPCDYPQSFEAYLVEQETNEELPLPSFITIASEAELFPFFLADESTLVVSLAQTVPINSGDYLVRVYSELANVSRNRTSLDFNVTVTDQTFFDWSKRPLFELTAADVSVAVGETKVFKPSYRLIPNGWDYAVSVNLGRSNKFTRYRDAQETFQTVGDLVEEVDVGTHVVLYEVIFTYEDFDPILVKASFNIIVTSLSDGAETDVEEFGEVDLTPRLDGPPRENLIPEIADESLARPQPFIVRMTATGLLTVGWDRRMDPLSSDIGSINERKVAVRDVSGLSKEQVADRIQFGTFIEQGETEKSTIALIDALEIRIERQESDQDLVPIDFTWEAVSFTDRYLTIQLDITNAQNIGEDFGAPDLLTLAFWDTSSFKSASGQEVRYGAQVSIEVIRQLDQQTKEILDSGLVYIKAYVVAIALASVALFSMGSLLSLWIFVNSLQIITHTTLLNTVMPGNVHYVLKEYLDLVRLNWPALNDWLYDQEDYRREGYQKGLYNVYLETSDYVHYFSQNLTLVAGLGLAVILTWVSLVVKDHMGGKPRFSHNRFMTRSHEPFWSNFALRFFYEFLLELCICVLINLAIVEADSFSAKLQWFTSLLVGLGIVVYILWLVSLFLKNGPFLPGFYEKGTYLRSFWMARPITLDYNAQAKLEAKEARKKRKQKRGEQATIKRQVELMKHPVTSKVTPLTFEPLNTDRPLMQEDNDLSPRLSQPEEEAKSHLNYGEHQIQQPLATHMSTAAMPHMTDISQDHDNDLFSKRKHTEEPLFTGEGSAINMDQKGSDRVMAAILDFDLTGAGSAAGRASVAEIDTSMGNPILLQNRETNACPSRQTNPLYQEVTPYALGERHKNTLSTIHQDEKGNSPRNSSSAFNDRYSNYNIFADAAASIKRQSVTPLPHAGPENGEAGSEARRREIMETRAAQTFQTPAFPHQSALISPLSYNNPGGQHMRNPSDPVLREVTNESDNDDQLFEGGSKEASPSPHKANKSSSSPGPKRSRTLNRESIANATDAPQRSLTAQSAKLKRSIPIKPIKDHLDPNYRYFQSQRTSQRASKKKILKAKLAHEQVILQTAKEMIAGGELAHKPKRFKTLYYGLKLNHPRNVALVYPLLFSLRRIVYALAIVFKAHQPLIGVWIVLGYTLLTLAFAVTEHPWKDPIINHQHTFNETMTYLILVCSLLFTNFVGTETRSNLGFSMIGLVTIFLVYNGIIMLRKVHRLLTLLFAKYKTIRQQRAIMAQVKTLKRKIHATLLEMQLELYPVEEPGPDSDDSEGEKGAKSDVASSVRVVQSTPSCVYKVDVERQPTGGLQAQIVEDLEAIRHMQLLKEQQRQQEAARKEMLQVNWQLQHIQRSEESLDLDPSDSEDFGDKIDLETRGDKIRLSQGSLSQPTIDEEGQGTQLMLSEGKLLSAEEKRKSFKRCQSQQQTQSEQNQLIGINDQIMLARPGSGSPADGQNTKPETKMGNLAEVVLDQESDSGAPHFKFKPLVRQSTNEIASIEVSSDFSESESGAATIKPKQWFQPDRVDALRMFKENSTKSKQLTDENHFTKLAREVLHAINGQPAKIDEAAMTETLKNPMAAIGVTQSQPMKKISPIKTADESSPQVASLVEELAPQQQVSSHQKEEKHMVDYRTEDRVKLSSATKGIQAVDQAQSGEPELKSASILKSAKSSAKGSKLASVQREAEGNNNSDQKQLKSKQKAGPKNDPDKLEEWTLEAMSAKNPFENSAQEDSHQRPLPVAEDEPEALTHEHILEVRPVQCDAKVDQKHKASPTRQVIRRLESETLQDKLTAMLNSVKRQTTMKEGHEKRISDLNISHLLQQTPERSSKTQSLLEQCMHVAAESGLASEEVSKFLELKEIKSDKRARANFEENTLSSPQLVIENQLKKDVKEQKKSLVEQPSLESRDESIHADFEPFMEGVQDQLRSLQQQQSSREKLEELSRGLAQIFNDEVSSAQFVSPELPIAESKEVTCETEPNLAHFKFTSPEKRDMKSAEVDQGSIVNSQGMQNPETISVRRFNSNELLDCLPGPATHGAKYLSVLPKAGTAKPVQSYRKPSKGDSLDVITFKSFQNSKESLKQRSFMRVQERGADQSQSTDQPLFNVNLSARKRPQIDGAEQVSLFGQSRNLGALGTLSSDSIKSPETASNGGGALRGEDVHNFMIQDQQERLQHLADEDIFNQSMVKDDGQGGGSTRVRNNGRSSILQRQKSALNDLTDMKKFSSMVVAPKTSLKRNLNRQTTIDALNRSSKPLKKHSIEPYLAGSSSVLPAQTTADDLGLPMMQIRHMSSSSAAHNRSIAADSDRTNQAVFGLRPFSSVTANSATAAEAKQFQSPASGLSRSIHTSQLKNYQSARTVTSRGNNAIGERVANRMSLESIKEDEAGFNLETVDEEQGFAQAMLDLKRAAGGAHGGANDSALSRHTRELKEMQSIGSRVRGSLEFSPERALAKMTKQKTSFANSRVERDSIGMTAGHLIVSSGQKAGQQSRLSDRNTVSPEMKK